MRDDYKLTVIVPFYNVEKYIEKNIQSLLSQSVEAELLFINDGSEDGSRDIVERYMMQNDCIRLVDQNNKGLGAARNAGISNAKGDYLLFIDSDDYIEDDCLANILGLAAKNDLDMLQLGHSRVDEKGNILERIINPDSEKVITGREWLIEGKMCHASCFFLYRTEFLKKLGFAFMEKVYHEDMDFSIHAIYRAKRFMSIDYNFYYYLIREGSISQHASIKRIYDYYEVASFVNSWVNHEVDETAYEGFFREYLSFLYSHVINMCIQQNFTISKMINDEMRRQISSQLISSKSIKYKIGGYLIRHKMYQIYKLIYILVK